MRARLRLVLISSCLLASLAQAPGACAADAAPATARLAVTNTMPVFWKFWDSSSALSEPERAQRFLDQVVGANPELFDASVLNQAGLSGKGGCADPQALVRRYLNDVQPYLARMRTLSDTASAQLPAYSRQFAATFPDFAPTQRVIFTVSLFSFDGATRTVAGNTALLFGIDGIARYHAPDENLQVLFDHELFHLYHAQVAPDLADDDVPLWDSLWEEGLATYVSAQMNPASTQDQVLLAPGLAERAQAMLPALAGELLAQSDSLDRDEYAAFFYSRNHRPELPPRSGYYVGYRVAQILGQGRTLPELARLRGPALKQEVRAALATLAGVGHPAAPDPLARDILRELINMNTTESVGDTAVAARAMARRLLAAGFPAADVQVLVGSNPKRGNLVARLRGSGRHKPVLILGHLDVVEAHREDWNLDPFTLQEKDGYFYGRGTQDMKDADAIAMATFIRLHAEGFVPDRDFILALTADEEAGTSNGVKWLLAEHRDLVDAEFAINQDAGGVDAVAGRPTAFNLEAAEKLYGDFELLATNRGGHSSLPTPDHAIYQLAQALVRLEHSPLPVELNAITRAWLQNMAKLETGQRAQDILAVLQTPMDTQAAERLTQDPIYNARLRTTCTATMLQGGHANNALPQRASANVNCRILPGHSLEEVQADLQRIVADPGVSVSWVDPADGKLRARAPATMAMNPPPVNAELLAALQKSVGERWPGIPILPEMEPGASDSIYTMAAGIPSYGFCGVAIDVDDVRAHGRDERVRVVDFDEGMAFFHRFVRLLGGGN